MQFFEIDEVATMLKVHPITIKREIERGNLIPFRVGSEYRISEPELSRYTNSKLNIKSDKELELEEQIKLLVSKLETKNQFVEGLKKQLLALR